MRGPSFCLLVLLAASPAAAQTSGNFATIVNRLHVGQLVFVVYGDGDVAEGTVVHVTADTLTLFATGGVQREIPAASIRRIDRRDSLWNGMIIGAAVLGTIGMSGAGASCSPDCGSTIAGAALYFGGIGAGVGALVDGTIRGRTPVYVAGGKPIGIDRPSPSVTTPPAALPPNAMPSPLQQLWTRVAPGNTIEVADAAGATIRGRFVASSATSVVVRAEGVDTVIPISRVRRVNRIGHHAGKGALIGALAGATGDLVNAAIQDGGGIAGTFSGTLWGAIIGRFIPKRTVVYDAPVTADAETPSPSRAFINGGFEAEGLIRPRSR